MPVAYTFATRTSSIPLSELDSNFATSITLGNTAIQLGNVVTTLNNMALVNPSLGTPSAGVLTNCTGLPLTTGVTGTLPVANGGTGITAFGTGVATALGQNVTGSGGIALATSPTLVTPVLGTPTSGTLTNCTGLPISTGVSGLGANVVTFLASPTSANLAAAVTDETGSGNVVFSTNPVVTNPTVNAYTEGVTALGTVGAAATINIAAGTIITATLTSATACTFTMPTATSGKSFTLLLKQPAAGSATTATFTGVKWPTGGAPTITAVLGRLDVLSFIADGTNWYGSYVQGYTY